MKLIFALGNPEARYDDTRHNSGFAVADRYAAQVSATFLPKAKFKALIAEYVASDQKILIAKPTTYYNNVGESYQAITNFYNIAPKDTLIIADDLALPFGTLRTRVGGSDAGNNGIKSINSRGGETSKRLRIGISNALREQLADADFVLSKFSADEQAELRHKQPQLTHIIEGFIADQFVPTTY